MLYVEHTIEAIVFLCILASLASKKSILAKTFIESDFKLLRNYNLVLTNALANMNLYLLWDTKQLT